MARITADRARKNAFDTVRTVGLLLPGVQATTRYDGSPVLKLGGCFMAGLATHRSAEPDSLVVIDAIPSSWCVCPGSIVTHCATSYPCHGG